MNSEIKINEILSQSAENVKSEINSCNDSFADLKDINNSDNHPAICSELSNGQFGKIDGLTTKTYAENRPKYILLEKTKSFYVMVHPILELFPKSEKFTLRQMIDETTLDAMRSLIMQNYQTSNNERRRLILNYMADVELIEILVQHSAIFRYISLGGRDKLCSLLKEMNSIAAVRAKNLEVQNEAV